MPLTALLIILLAGATAAGETPVSLDELLTRARVGLTLRTTHGEIALAVYPPRAPGTVKRFLEVATNGGYDGSAACAVRGGKQIVLGCVEPDVRWKSPAAVDSPGPWPDEIDGVALGLGERLLDDPARVHSLWQQELIPRHRALEASDAGSTPRLTALVEGVRERGMAATAELRGKSMLWYYEALGYAYDEAGSDLRFERGAIATANRWPGEADARFLIVLADDPDRDGRQTVYGRVLERSWPTLRRIVELPADKMRRPLPEVGFRVETVVIDPP